MERNRADTGNSALLAPVGRDHGVGHDLPCAPYGDEQFSCSARLRRRAIAIVVFACWLGSLFGTWALFGRSWVWLPLIAGLLVLVPRAACAVALALIRPSAGVGALDEASFGTGTSQDDVPVDVFLPVCGDDLGVLADAFAYVSAQAWRGTVRVYVLDDGYSPEVAALARAHHFVYVAGTGRSERTEPET